MENKGFSIIAGILILGIAVSAVAAARKAAGHLSPPQTDTIEYRVPTTLGDLYCDRERTPTC